MPSREEVLYRRVFQAGDRVFHWSDVVVAARAWSDWTEMERLARHALAMAAHPAEDPSPADREAAQADFRYRRGLLAADDLVEWLDWWGVGLDDWARQVEGERRREEEGPPAAAGDESLADAVWAQAVCSGRLELLGRRLAQFVAVRLAHGEDLPAGDLDARQANELEEGYERFCERLVTPGALERLRAEAQVELVQLDCRVFAHPDEDVTREAALCVREEGRDLEEVAAESGARLDSRRFFIGDAEADWRTRLIAVGSGDLVGPLRSHGESCLLEVIDRSAPSLEEEHVRSRLTARLVGQAVEREVLRRIRWDERLGG